MPDPTDQAASPSAPLRAELLSPSRLAQLGARIASQQHWSAEQPPRTTPLLAMVDDAAASLSADTEALSAEVREGRAASPAGEWLLDNSYLVEEQILLIREDLPAGYGSELPRLTAGPYERFPRIFAALLELVAHTDSRLDAESLHAFIGGFQQIAPLTMGEVWAVPIMLRVGLVENVRRLSHTTVIGHRAERDADLWVERLLMAAQDAPNDLRRLIAAVDRDADSQPRTFLLRLAHRLVGTQAGTESVNAWLAERLAASGISIERDAAEQQQQRAADQFSIANSITSMRLLDALDWREFFEDVSLAEAALRADPAGVYSAMEFESRDRYRHALEQMARRCALSEIELAGKVVARARAALASDPDDNVRAHVGWWLVRAGRYELERTVGYRPVLRERMYRGPLRQRGLLYFGSLAVVWVALLAVFAAYGRWESASGARLAWLVVLAALPLSELAVAVVNRLAAAVFPARLLPKLDHERPATEAQRTLVVVPTLLSSVESTCAVIANLEVAYLANRDPNIVFGLLGDLRASLEPTHAGDAVIVEAAVNGITQLNERYEAEHGQRPFHLLVRDRVFDHSEQRWMGWERKRGALVELVREMRGDVDVHFGVKIGDAEFRRSCTYVITLDSDTVLPRDAARRLIGTISHPLNQSRVFPGDRRVKHGYGLVQPRVGMTLEGAERSRYAELYSGPTGIDPYASAISDSYQDLFGEGSFTGKGIFEVDAFRSMLEGRFPDDELLSHDLVEGSFLRTGLASDIEVLDDHPANYLAAASRSHRWIRGDWQTLPYLWFNIRDASGASGANPLSFVQRYKIADNLRRSLVAPASVTLFALGWWLVPNAALTWPLAVALIVLFPAYFSFLGSIATRPESVTLRAVVKAAATDFVEDTERGVLGLATLPHQAWLSTDAIVRALWRRFVSHRKVLAWETAADAELRAGTSLITFVRVLGVPAAASLVALFAGAGASPWRLVAALPLAATWVLGPWVAWRMSAQLPPHAPEALSEKGVARLRRTARKTWRYFETFVTAEGHHLAPDNFQESPGAVIAWRTSPTNIGLQLLSSLSALDLGYVTLDVLVDSVSATISTMAGLERHKGHFYNWYDTRTLEPLRPAYISTVDSGNLAGHLLALRVGLLEATEAPILGTQVLAGAHDTVQLALEDLLAAPDSPDSVRSTLEELLRVLLATTPPRSLGEWHALLLRLNALADEAAAALQLASAETSADSEPSHDLPSSPAARAQRSMADAQRAVRAPVDLLESVAPWAMILTESPADLTADPALAPLLSHTPSLVGLAEGLEEALKRLDVLSSGSGPIAAWAAAVSTGISESRPRGVELLARTRLTADIAREMWEHTDFSMLFDPHRQLFSIGYNLEQGRLDPSSYDLLASECRLASYLAIAKGDVPQDHWFRLGRALVATKEGNALVSWSASMFEYLMPLLVMHDWSHTLLNRTYSTVVRRQIAYGTERSVPWGVSESAFNAKDASLTYQYQAFGVPGLGLKRGLSDDVVVAPYACMLALPIDPSAVAENLAAFSAEGAEGDYGYYEALDYTAGRVPAGKRRAVVASYFAHHQGMSFVALAGALAGARMRERFHADPIVASAELLLQERVPRHAQIVAPHVEEVREVRSVRELPPPVARGYTTANTPVPATHFLSNGRYSVMVTNGGGGYSRFEGLAITRYREDVTRDCWGTFFYVRDTSTGSTFCTPHNPYPSTPDEFHCSFAPDKAEYTRLDGELETRIEIAVSPEDDVEVRRIAVANRGRSARTLEITSYFEIALAPQSSDQAHKSFSNLFVETEALPEARAVVFSRRPRSTNEQRYYGLHLVACEQEPCDWSFETDRAAFLGRLRGADDPIAVRTGGALGGSHGAVLDPCCALRRTVTVNPGETVRLAFVTGVARSREDALCLAEKYHDPRSSQRAIDLAWSAAQLELRDLGITPSQAVTLERLASRLLLTDPYSELKVTTPAESRLRVDGLWSLGISGDFPILLVRVEQMEHAPLVRQALLAHQYWRHKGLVADLVVLNTRPTGYSDELDDRLRLLVRTGHALQMLDKPGGVFLRRGDQVLPEVLDLLLTVARATLDGDGGSIALQLNRRGTRPALPGDLHVARSPEPYPAPAFERPELVFDNGIGGFDAQSGEYVIVLEDEQVTPAPWIDVLANPDFGCTVSEAGVGCTWALNSHENRVTTWNNDPVSDGSGEGLYVRDEETGEYWSPTPLPVRAHEPYVIRHGRGSVAFEHTSHGIEHSLDWFVDPVDPVRLARLTLRNLGNRQRSLSVTQFVEWVMGDSRSRAQQTVVTHYDSETETLTAHNRFNFDFPGRVGFVAADRPLHSWTASRTEFVGRNGRPCEPAAMKRARLGAASGRFHDNCGALMTRIDLAPGDEVSVCFLLGQAHDEAAARELVIRYRAEGEAQACLDRAHEFWDALTGRVQVKTPDPRLDLMLNGQLLYQVLACRLWGRTATYQSSGAYGFRDQLQDVLALVHVRPDLVRAQVVEATRHQFPEGDVLHWWQPYSGRGVRTRITDDRHWLPLVVAEYLDATGDTSVLDEVTAFIAAGPLAPEAEDAYVRPEPSEEGATVYEHCVRALETGRPTGEHGLPLIGGGDWNDGMNRVGHEGRGESVWLAWFLGFVLNRFAPVCESRGETGRAQEYREWAQRLAQAAEASWDGAWYRRAYFDDGTPLGTAEASECRIDAIAQSWATISGLADPRRAEVALESVAQHLVHRDSGLVALLAPPFDRMTHDPGYIKGYVPGVRENGGQYTHAALWVVLAHLLRGDGDQGHSLLDLINPISHALDTPSAQRYAVEPYVLAADVYAVHPHAGRGGWTWYTGSASWFYRVALGHLLGVRARYEDGQHCLEIAPCIPPTWPGFSVEYHYETSVYRIAVQNPRGATVGVGRITVDDGLVPDGLVRLNDDGLVHEVTVTMLGG